MTWRAVVAILYRFPEPPCLLVPQHAAPTREIDTRAMANIKSQIKRNRTSEAARERNKSVRSEVKTRTKSAEAAIAAGEDNAEELTRAAIKAIDTAATKGVYHRNAAARRKSRLMRDLNGASAS